MRAWSPPQLRLEVLPPSYPAVCDHACTEVSQASAKAVARSTGISQQIVLSLCESKQVVQAAWQASWVCAAGVRLAYSHVVVLDSFFGEPEREALLAELTQPGWDHSKVSIEHQHDLHAPQSGEKTCLSIYITCLPLKACKALIWCRGLQAPSGNAKLRTPTQPPSHGASGTMCCASWQRSLVKPCWRSTLAWRRCTQSFTLP